MAMTFPLRGRMAVCAVLLLALVGCGQPPEPGPARSETGSSTPVTRSTVPDRQPRTLVLKATGSAKVTKVTYTLDRKVERKGAAELPWRKSVTVPADGDPHSWRLDVAFTGNGRVNLVAIFEGAVVARGGSAGSGNVTGNASVGGTVSG
ncbi:MAG: hypothetical protein GEV10_02490 [Streptosporangiales bacterium]|nr:hypothetical protein [Streptosporangiales bacterium]